MAKKIKTVDCDSCSGLGWQSDDGADVRGVLYRRCDDCGGKGEVTVKPRRRQRKPAGDGGRAR